MRKVVAEEMSYQQTAKSLRWLAFNFPEVHPANDDVDRMSNNIHLNCSDGAAAIEKLTADLKQCRNELCLRCGQYKMAHKGACDGCRWHKMPEVGIE
jgi:hypothetical protein